MSNGYYVYAIGKMRANEDRTKAPHDNGRPICNEVEQLDFFSGKSGIDDQFKLECVSVRNLRAFASKASLIEFGQDLKQNVNDLKWLEGKARTHDDIVRFLHDHEPIVPVRFATVFKAHEGVLKFLEENYNELHSLLQTIEGCCEMGVTLYFAKPCLLDHLRVSDEEIKPLLKKMENSKQGAAFMLGRKLDQLLESKFRELVDKQLNQAIQSLNTVSKQIKPGPLNPDRGNPDLFYANLACLVPNRDLEKFHQKVDALRDGSCIDGQTIKRTGPWPCYSFSFLQFTNSR